MSNSWEYDIVEYCIFVQICYTSGMYITRLLEKPIQESLFKQKVVILYGPRQAGKTTLLKHIIREHKDVKWIDCELIENNQLLTERKTEVLFSLVKNMKIVIFDEAQTVTNIGQVLKTLIDHHPEVQYIATGSSSFDLSNMISEPLTGRSIEFTLYPLGLSELVTNNFEAEHKLDSYLKYGMYPGIFDISEEDKVKRLNTLTSQYLYKNILDSSGVKKSDLVANLLKLLAHQIGSEFSIRELAEKLNSNAATIEKYLDIFEKNFIIVRLPSYSNNMRDEVTRSKKIYFIDLGIRNILVNNFSSIDTFSRVDVGHLFENFCIIERLKHLKHTDTQLVQGYFWRNYQQKELDYVEEDQHGLRAFECKWDSKKGKRFPPKNFTEQYPLATYTLVGKENIFDFVTGKSDSI